MTTGHRLPDVVCPRALKGCRSLSQIIADEKSSFVCCGHIEFKERQLKQDRFRVCWKNHVVDEMGDYDERDLKSTVAVMSQALVIDHDIALSNGDIEA